VIVIVDPFWWLKYVCGVIASVHTHRMKIHKARFRTPLLSEKIKHIAQSSVAA